MKCVYDGKDHKTPVITRHFDKVVKLTFYRVHTSDKPYGYVFNTEDEAKAFVTSLAV